MGKRYHEGYMAPLTATRVFRRWALGYWRTCQWCNRAVRYATVTLDHIQPASLDGPETLANFCLACLDCNHQRGSRWYPGLVVKYGPANWQEVWDAQPAWQRPVLPGVPVCVPRRGVMTLYWGERKVFRGERRECERQMERLVAQVGKVVGLEIRPE